MKKIHTNNNENGLTLIEVLASIVILTLILTAFLMMFLQAAKTNLTSEKIIDATYYAQVEMENIYALSGDGKEKISGMNTLNYNKAPSSENNPMIFRKEENHKFFEVKLTEDKDALTYVLVKVYNNENDKKLEAQMETILSWEGNDN